MIVDGTFDRHLADAANRTSPPSRRDDGRARTPRRGGQAAVGRPRRRLVFVVPAGGRLKASQVHAHALAESLAFVSRRSVLRGSRPANASSGSATRRSHPLTPTTSRSGSCARSTPRNATLPRRRSWSRSSELKLVGPPEGGHYRDEINGRRSPILSITRHHFCSSSSTARASRRQPGPRLAHRRRQSPDDRRRTSRRPRTRRAVRGRA